MWHMNSKSGQAATYCRTPCTQLINVCPALEIILSASAFDDNMGEHMHSCIVHTYATVAVCYVYPRGMRTAYSTTHMITVWMVLFQPFWASLVQCTLYLAKAVNQRAVWSSNKAGGLVSFCVFGWLLEKPFLFKGQLAQGRIPGDLWWRETVGGTVWCHRVVTVVRWNTWW